MLRRTSSAELTEWMAYEQMTGPLGPVRQDILFAQLCAVVANSQKDKKSRPAKPKDFLPKWEKRGPAQGWQQQKSMARMLNSAFGGTVNGKPVKPERPRKPAPRYQVREREHLHTVVDTTTQATEWTGLDQAQATAIAERMNHN